MRTTRTVRSAVAAAAALAILALAACSSGDGIANQGDSGYISGNGAVEEFPANERIDAPDFGGTLTNGDEWSSQDHADEVMVVNFWYAACPPCRVEAPMLTELATEYDGDVTFIGVNVRDGAAQANAFDESFDIPYESILDADTSDAQLAFAGTITPTAVPTTLVIAADGTIAARVTGALPEASILATILDDELA
ncbi:TlpA family protein disulfide reductase [Agrococcus jejuensis]|uniref:Thiol-disulfide isomerase or thioredoxin n=1 Tax=Agrococcus jejuensis TaxID=399736 RepID=A0A1G8EVK7_9MICO|nr:TlpA disulfide reductase family protein [Agrococcus jejuensis]SDH73941.1 Thiol-disulfide isomerase or thioredoxin [Agrococcus jejuensis]